MSNRIIRATDTAQQGSRVLLGESKPAAPISAPQEPPKPDRESLRLLFADELDALRAAVRKDAHQQGLEDAKAETQREREQHEKTLREAHDKAQAAIDEQLAALRAMLKSWDEARQTYVRQQESVLVELVFRTVLKILGKAAAERALVPELVANAVQQVIGGEIQRIRLHPGDAARLEKLNETDHGQAFADIELVADPQLAPGDCLVESRHGSLDASLDAQLGAFRDLLLTTYTETDVDDPADGHGHA